MGCKQMAIISSLLWRSSWYGVLMSKTGRADLYPDTFVDIGTKKVLPTKCQNQDQKYFIAIPNIPRWINQTKDNLVLFLWFVWPWTFHRWPVQHMVCFTSNGCHWRSVHNTVMNTLLVLQWTNTNMPFPHGLHYYHWFLSNRYVKEYTKTCFMYTLGTYIQPLNCLATIYKLNHGLPSPHF